MTLTTEQTKELYQFLKKTELYNGSAIASMTAMALLENDVIVVNANW